MPSKEPFAAPRSHPAARHEGRFCHYLAYSRAWKGGLLDGVLKTAIPLKGERLPKTQEKPPFQTWAEIACQIKQGVLSEAEEAELWDCLFLTVAEIDDLLEYVRRHATKPFVYSGRHRPGSIVQLTATADAFSRFKEDGERLRRCRM